MAKPIIQIFNGETGEVIIREMTADEIKEHEKTLADIALEIANKTSE